MVAVPELETLRLVLGGHRREHFADLLEMWSEPEVTRHIGGRPFTREEIWTRLLRYVGHWQMCGFGYWTAHEKATGRFVGELGFADYKRDMEPDLAGTPEIGWVLSPSAHGRGLATEAVRAILAWGDEHLPLARTWCLIRPGNLASLAVAGKVGYREFGRTTYKGSDCILLDRVKHD